MPSSRKQKQGKVKTGRENEREPVQASSIQLSAKRLMPIFEPYVKSAFQTALRTPPASGYSRLPSAKSKSHNQSGHKGLPYGFSQCVG